MEARYTEHEAVCFDPGGDEKLGTRISPGQLGIQRLEPKALLIEAGCQNILGTSMYIGKADKMYISGMKKIRTLAANIHNNEGEPK